MLTPTPSYAELDQPVHIMLTGSEMEWRVAIGSLVERAMQTNEVDPAYFLECLHNLQGATEISNGQQWVPQRSRDLTVVVATEPSAFGSADQVAADSTKAAIETLIALGPMYRLAAFATHEAAQAAYLDEYPAAHQPTVMSTRLYRILSLAGRKMHLPEVEKA